MLHDKLDGTWLDGAYWEYDWRKSPCVDGNAVVRNANDANAAT